MEIHEELKNAIKKQGRTISWVAEQVDIAQPTLSQKLNGKAKFRYDEVMDIKKVLGL